MLFRSATKEIQYALAQQDMIALRCVMRLGWEVLREVSERTGIPVVLTTGRRPFLEEFLRDGRDARFTGEAMPLEPYMLRSPDNFAHGKI